MRLLIRFLMGLMLLSVMFASLFLAGMIFDTNEKNATQAYFFQPDNNPNRRPGVPATPTDIGEENMLIKLVDRYITEYFYVTPDMVEMQKRMDGKTVLGPGRLSTPEVFNHWKENIAPDIQQMAEDKMLRLVRVNSVDLETVDGNYWRVEYETTTWPVPNNLSVVPAVDNGIVYLKIDYEPGLRKSVTLGGQAIEKYLESGGDPAGAFKFLVTDVIIDGQ